MEVEGGMPAHPVVLLVLLAPPLDGDIGHGAALASFTSSLRMLRAN